MSNTDIIIHDEKDNVGVVVIDSTRKDQEYSCWIMRMTKLQESNQSIIYPWVTKLHLKTLKKETLF